MKKNPALLSLFAATLFTASLSTGAFDANDAEDHIDATYDSATERCDALSGNDKDVCMQRAKANKAEAKARIESEYKVAKEKCDSLSGSAKDRCVDQAKAKYGQ